MNSDLGNKEIMAKNILYYLEINDKSRHQLGEAVGVAYSTVCEWVNARKYPRIDKIELMAHWFGINKADLVERPGYSGDVESDADKIKRIYQSLDPERAQRLMAYACDLLHAFRFEQINS